MKVKDIVDAYIRIRQIDNTIPDEVLDFMYKAALSKCCEENNADSELVAFLIDDKTTTP